GQRGARHRQNAERLQTPAQNLDRIEEEAVILSEGGLPPAFSRGGKPESKDLGFAFSSAVVQACMRQLPKLCHPERAQRSQATERESKDPEFRSWPMLPQSIFTMNPHLSEG